MERLIGPVIKTEDLNEDASWRLLDAIAHMITHKSSVTGICDSACRDSDGKLSNPLHTCPDRFRTELTIALTAQEASQIDLWVNDWA